MVRVKGVDVMGMGCSTVVPIKFWGLVKGDRAWCSLGGPPFVMFGRPFWLHNSLTFNSFFCPVLKIQLWPWGAKLG